MSDQKILVHPMPSPGLLTVLGTTPPKDPKVFDKAFNRSLAELQRHHCDVLVEADPYTLRPKRFCHFCNIDTKHPWKCIYSTFPLQGMRDLVERRDKSDYALLFDVYAYDQRHGHGAKDVPMQLFLTYDRAATIMGLGFKDNMRLCPTWFVTDCERQIQYDFRTDRSKMAQADSITGMTPTKLVTFPIRLYDKNFVVDSSVISKMYVAACADECFCTAINIELPNPSPGNTGKMILRIVARQLEPTKELPEYSQDVVENGVNGWEFYTTLMLGTPLAAGDHSDKIGVPLKRYAVVNAVYEVGGEKYLFGSGMTDLFSRDKTQSVNRFFQVSMDKIDYATSSVRQKLAQLILGIRWRGCTDANEAERLAMDAINEVKTTDPVLHPVTPGVIITATAKDFERVKEAMVHGYKTLYNAVYKPEAPVTGKVTSKRVELLTGLWTNKVYRVTRSGAPSRIAPTRRNIVSSPVPRSAAPSRTTPTEKVIVSLPAPRNDHYAIEATSGMSLGQCTFATMFNWYGGSQISLSDLLYRCAEACYEIEWFKLTYEMFVRRPRFRQCTDESIYEYAWEIDGLLQLFANHVLYPTNDPAFEVCNAIAYILQRYAYLKKLYADVLIDYKAAISFPGLTIHHGYLGFYREFILRNILLAAGVNYLDASRFLLDCVWEDHPEDYTCYTGVSFIDHFVSRKGTLVRRYGDVSVYVPSYKYKIHTLPANSADVYAHDDDDSYYCAP